MLGKIVEMCGSGEANGKCFEVLEADSGFGAGILAWEVG